MTALRRSIFWVHLVLGAAVGLVVLFFSITGMMLSFRPQILAWAEGDRYPTRELKETSPVRQTMKKIERWHRWFGLDDKYKPLATQIKAVCTGAFVIMIVSGFYLWWPRKVMKVQGGKGSADWYRHNAVGFWSAPWLLIIAVTGLLIIYLPRPKKPAPGVEPSAQDSTLRQIRKLNEHIHTGEAAGLPGQIVAFVASGGAVVLVWTGMNMARRRFFKPKKDSYV